VEIDISFRNKKKKDIPNKTSPHQKKRKEKEKPHQFLCETTGSGAKHTHKEMTQ